MTQSDGIIASRDYRVIGRTTQWTTVHTLTRQRDTQSHTSRAGERAAGGAQPAVQFQSAGSVGRVWTTGTYCTVPTHKRSPLRPWEVSVSIRNDGTTTRKTTCTVSRVRLPSTTHTDATGVSLATAVCLACEARQPHDRADDLTIGDYSGVDLVAQVRHQ